MRDLPRAAVVYVVAVWLVGFAILAGAAQHLVQRDPPPVPFWLFVGLAVAAELWQLKLSLNAIYSVGVAIILATVAVFGVEEAILLGAIGVVAGDTTPMAQIGRAHV